MNEKLEKIRTLCKEVGFPEGKLTDEFLFTIDVVDLFYYKRNIGQVDIKNGFTDGSNDGGIDFIYSDGTTMYLIQGKSSGNLKIEDIKGVFYKMAETVSNFDNWKYDKYSKSLQTAFKNKYDDLDDDKNIELVLFTKTEFTDSLKKKFQEFAKEEVMSDYTISMYDAKDIESREAALFQGADLVKDDSVQIYPDEGHSKNILHYGEDGIIVNIKATSLKNLYVKHADKGLFSYNLREHITQKSVDQGIEDTIKQNADKFWFYNNGVIIGCSDYIVDGNKIKLYGFSIINGAQTTTQIGKSKLVDSDHDFAVVCKIVRAKNSMKNDEEFIGRISEASNSQKPIKPRDLKSNAGEQKRMQMGAAKNKYPLAIEIKRGVKPKNYKKVEKWQRVTNDYVGQLIYSCVFQRPGPARNSKTSMYSSAKLYKQLFMRKYDYDCLYDLVRLGNEYDIFLEKFSANPQSDINQVALAYNGKLSILATAIYLYKKQKGIIENASSDGVHRDNVKGLLISDYPKDDLDSKLHNLFKFIIREMNKLYDQKKSSEKITSYSNFFKSEKLYDLILRDFDELDDYDKEKLEQFMEVFSLKKQD